VRCDDGFGRPVDYLFYSHNISPGVFGSGALVIRVLYRSILSPEVDQITLWNIRDSGFDYERKWIEENCLSKK